MENKALLKEFIHSAFESGAAGRVSKSKEKLGQVWSIIRDDPFILWDEKDVRELGKSLIIMHHFELFDEENINISIAHLAYMYLTRAIELIESQKQESDNEQEDFFEVFKDRIIVLSQFDDSFYESIKQFFIQQEKEYSKAEKQYIKKFVNDKIPVLVYYDIMNLDEHHIDISAEKYLSDTCHSIERKYEINKEELKEAKLLHHLLYNYIKTKVKRLDFDF